MAYSTQTAVSDGTLQLLSLTVEYIDREDITVIVDMNDGEGPSEYAPGTIWNWVGREAVRFDDALPLGAVVVLRRATEVDTLLNKFTEGAMFNAPTLDENFDQLLFLVQEAREGSGLTGVFNDLDMHGFRLRRVGEASDDGDAVNLGQMRDLVRVSPELQRTLRVSRDEEPLAELPGPSVRGGKFLAFDTAGRPTVATPVEDSATDVRMALANPTKGAAMVAYGGGTVADKLDEIVSGAVTEPLVDAKVDTHNHDANSHPELRTRIVSEVSSLVTSEADRAETARDAAFVNADVYPDVATGRAAVADGEQFQVVEGEELVRYRRDSSSAQTEVARYPSAETVHVLNKTTVKGVPGKNLFDLEAATDGWAVDNSGVPIPSTNRSISDFIEVVPGETYTSTTLSKLVWYNAAKEGIGDHQSAPVALVAPPGSAFVRLDMTTSNKSSTQFEVGAVRTAYEPYRIVLSAGSVTHSSMGTGTVQSEQVVPAEVYPWHLEDAVYLNMHDGRLREGVRYSESNGITESSSTVMDATYWIPAKPSTQYTVNNMSRVFFYNNLRDFVGISADSTFITPAGCRWLRFNLSTSVSFRFQLNEGGTANAPFPQPHKYELRNLLTDTAPAPDPEPTPGAIPERIYNLADAWYAWRSGEKFPIAFMGDSTTHGNGVWPSGARSSPSADFWGEDYIRENAYPAVLERLLRTASGSTIGRCYNAGYSGRNASWASENIANILSNEYSDCQMVGISYGINDRSLGVTDKAMADGFRTRIEIMIEWCYANGKQPFLLTTQPVTEPGDQVPTNDLTTSERAESVANRVKRDLAAKWGLELVDINKFGREFQTYSAFPLLSPVGNPPTGIYEAIGNTIHWANVGHQYEAELIFAHICPRVIWSEKGEQLDFSTQQVVSSIDRANVTQIAIPNNGFKIQSVFTKPDTADTKLQEFWLFNNSRGRMALTAYAADAAESAYVKLNGNVTALGSVSQEISESLEIGLHHIEAWSGETASVNWCGFRVTPVAS